MWLNFQVNKSRHEKRATITYTRACSIQPFVRWFVYSFNKLAFSITKLKCVPTTDRKRSKRKTRKTTTTTATMNRSQIHSISLIRDRCSVVYVPFLCTVSISSLRLADRALSFYCLLGDFASLSAAFSVFICALFCFVRWFIRCHCCCDSTNVCLCLSHTSHTIPHTVLLIILFPSICCCRAAVAVAETSCPQSCIIHQHISDQSNTNSHVPTHDVHILCCDDLRINSK